MFKVTSFSRLQIFSLLCRFTFDNNKKYEQHSLENFLVVVRTHGKFIILDIFKDN